MRLALSVLYGRVMDKLFSEVCKKEQPTTDAVGGQMDALIAALLRCGTIIGCVLAGVLGVFVSPADGADEALASSDGSAYESSGLFEDFDVTSRFFISLPGGPRHPEGLESLRLRGNTGRFRSYMADSHWGLTVTRLERCFDCHPEEAKNIHSARAKIACRQCHSDEPIAGISHFYSLMNPIRRHAYVCAKCHELANVSYGTYLVHSPNPAALTTREVFPLLFYAFWGLMSVALGTFIVFLPHTFLWGVREFIAGKKKASGRLIRRFTPAQRLFHLFLVLSFLNQSVTGLARLYIETRWGTMLTSLFGGTYGALAFHKWGGVFMLALFAVHLGYALRNIDWRRFSKSIYDPVDLFTDQV